MLARTVSLAALLITLLTGCSTTEISGSATPAAPAGGPAGGDVELVRGAACAEVTFWIASESGRVVVTVTVDVADRPAGAPTEFTYELPDPDALVTVHTGTGDLSENFCTDVISGPQPTRQPAVAGTVVLTVDPPGEGCGDSTARLRVDGLVAEDGTTFAPIEVESSGVGCSVGG